MLELMTPPKKWRSMLVVLVLGLWAGGAAAQSEDDGGWFEESAPTDRPQLKIHGDGPYDPPPPDFRADPPGPPGEGNSVTTYDEDEPGDEADVESADSQQRAVTEFSPQLAPYGRWVDDPYYGRVWVPARTVVGAEFRPYVSGGHWELTADDDWYWVSDYPFGGVTFHYGRWAYLSAGYWGWVPGYVYSPAWVDFRIGSSGYVGWGPAPPYAVWRSGVYISLGVRRPVPYIFCPTTYVFSSTLPRYVIHDHYRARSIAASTYRYRPRYAAGAVRVRGPSTREAHIPHRYVPARRVIAQPRGGYAARDGRTLDKGRSYDARRSEARRGSDERRYFSAGAPRDREVSRDNRWRDGGSRPRSRAVPDASPRWREGARPQGRDLNRDGRVDRPRQTPNVTGGSPRGWRQTPDVRRNDMRGRDGRGRDPGRGNYGRGDPRAPQPRAVYDSGRSRSYDGRDRASGRPSAPPDRRAAPAASPSDRRGGGQRGGSAPSRAPTQHRSRGGDGRGSSR